MKVDELMSSRPDEREIAETVAEMVPNRIERPQFFALSLAYFNAIGKSGRCERRTRKVCGDVIGPQLRDALEHIKSNKLFSKERTTWTK